MQVLTLGPDGTFSHEAAKQLFPQGKIVFGNTIDEVFFRLAKNEVAEVVVPLENNLSGFIEETITHLMKYDLLITGKTTLKITYHLAGTGKTEEAKTLYAQPHAYKQCKKSLKNHCPNIKVIETSSNAHSAIQIKGTNDPTIFALVSPFSLTYYSLSSVMNHLEDNPDNTTTFYSISKTPAKKTGNDATAFLLFSNPMPTIEKYVVDLSLEKKIPIINLKNLLLHEGNTPLYFIEIKGHIEDSNVAEFHEALNKKILTKHLGSYPQ